MAGERILLVDDEKSIRTTLAAILNEEGYRPVAVGSGPEALTRLGEEVPDLVILDIWLPDMDGIETLAEVKRQWPELPVVMISGHGTIETAVKATKLGAYDYIEKPLSLEKTLLVIDRALEHGRLRAREPPPAGADRAGPRDHRDQPGDDRAAAADQHRRAEQRPGADHRRERHRQGAGGPGDPRRSPRGATRPFVEVNCAAIPDELIESRAVRPREGRLHRARSPGGAASSSWPTAARCSSTRSATCRSGTQAKVLRVLEEQTVERVGGHETVRVDVRVIAATNQDLQERDRPGPLPRGPLLPPQRHPDRGPAAAAPEGGRPAAGRALLQDVLAPSTASARRRCRATRWSASWPTTGPGTCASCATWWSASSS